MRVITLKIGLVATVFAFLVAGWAFVPPRDSNIVVTGNRNTVLVRSSLFRLTAADRKVFTDASEVLRPK